MADSNDDLDNAPDDFEDAFEVQGDAGGDDFEPAEAPPAPAPAAPATGPADFGEEPEDAGDPLNDLELELGAELEQIVKPKEEFRIGGDDEYESIESEAVPSAPKRSEEEEEARRRARARAERNRLRRLAEREEAAAQEEEEEPAPRRRRRAPPQEAPEDDRRRRAEVQRKARQKEIAMNRRIVTGAYDDDEDERPQREYRGDGEWDTSYRRRKPRSIALIIALSILGFLLIGGLVTGGVFAYLSWSSDKEKGEIELVDNQNPRSPRSAPSFDDEDEYRPMSPSQLEDEMISKSELLRASGSVLRAILNRLDTIRTELDRIDESRRRIDDAFLDIEEFLTEIQNQRVRNDRDERRRSGRDSRKSKGKKRKRNN